MFIKAEGYAAQNPHSGPIVRCPGCRQVAVLESVGTTDLRVPGLDMLLGQRRCPAPGCHAHIFFVIQGDRVIASYPAQRLEFDTSNLPTKVTAALEEAAKCHAGGCFIAAAIMVRKTLEELCRDRGANGANLKEKIRALRDKVVIPGELLDGLDELRLLGNDAAHIESQEYNQIGKEEVEAGLEFATEVLKAVYQYSKLLGKLRALKKGTAGSTK